MTDRYCLKYGRLQKVSEEDADRRRPKAIFHFTADGELREVSELPPLKEGEGSVMYTGDFYVEPLEILIEYLKADSAQKWLEALILRHTDRVRQIGENLWVQTEMEEVNA